MRLNVSLAVLAATLVAATPAAAQQAAAQADARGTVLQSLTLVNQTDLDFGTVAPDLNNPGTVSIDADTGVRSVTGGVATLPGATSRAQFDGSGTAGNTVQLTLAQPAGGVICTPGCGNTVGATLNLDSGGTTRTIPAGGVYSVYVGGDFAIAANQASGVYSAQFDLTAIYQ